MSPRTILVLLPLSLVLALASGCGGDDDSGSRLDASSGTDAGSVSDMGPISDAGSGDGGAGDASGPEDAGSGDGGDGDASSSGDAGDGQDLGPMDTATEDLGAPDIGGDAGPTDADSDAGPSDAGPSDAGTGDGGAMDGGPGDAGVIACNPVFGQSPPTCGGNPSGTWRFREACGTTALQQQLQQQCPGATVSNVMRTVTGTIAFQGSSYTLNLVDAATADVGVPLLCALAVGGCSSIPALLAQAGASGTCTTLPSGNCDCQVQATLSRMETGSYTQVGATLVVGGDTYDHCVTNRNLEIRERVTGSVYVLSR